MSAWVLGLDLSLVSTGVATITTSTAATHRIESKPPRRAKGDKTPATLAERHARIAAVVDQVSHHAGLTGQPDSPPAVAVVEGPSYGSVGAGTWERAWLWGAVIDRLIGHGIPVALVPPSTRAMWATGSGAGSKSLVGVHMSRMWPDLDPNVTDDEWDALALASMGAQHIGIRPVDLARHREHLRKIAWPERPGDADE